MKQLKIGITAIALLVGAVSAFASNTSKFIGTYWTTVGSSTVYTSNPCLTGAKLCGHSHTVGGKLKTTFFKP